MLGDTIKEELDSPSRLLHSTGSSYAAHPTQTSLLLSPLKQIRSGLLP